MRKVGNFLIAVLILYSVIFGQKQFDLLENNLVELRFKSGETKNGFVKNLREEDFIFLDKNSGLFSLFQVDQVEKVKVLKSLSSYSQLAQNPSLGNYWKDYFLRVIGTSAFGYSFAVFQNGQPIAVGSYGYSKLPQLPDDKGIPMTPQTRMQIASVSKPITAVTLLHAMEKKGISTETKFWSIMQPLFPNLRNTGKGVDEITIAQLLSHRSGYDFDYIYTPRLKNMEEFLKKDVPKEIGKSYIYSNINYSLARTLIEQISGQDYENYVLNEIFRPAGIDGARLQVNKDEAAYIYRIGDLAGKPLADDFRDEGGAYGWYATVEEIAKFLGMVRNNKYLSSEMTEKMFKNSLGWQQIATLAGNAYRHEGQWAVPGNYGIHTGVVILPDGIEAVLFINTKSRLSASKILVEGFNKNVFETEGFINPKDSSLGIVTVEIPIHVEEIRCTTDGSNPTSQSPVYFQPIIEKLPLTVKCQGFIGNKPITFVRQTKVTKEGKNS